MRSIRAKFLSFSKSAGISLPKFLEDVLADSTEPTGDQPDNPSASRNVSSYAGSSDYDNDYGSDTDLEPWPWTFPEFDTTEEEIKFYRARVEWHEENDPRQPSIIRDQLMLGTAYAAAGHLEAAEEYLCDVRNHMVETWGWNHLASLAYHRDHEGDLEIAVDHLRDDYGDDNHSATRAARHLVSLRLRVGDSHEARRLCDQFQFEGLPENGNLCEWHEDGLIPSLTTQRRVQASGNLPADQIRDRIFQIGPQFGMESFRALEWVRNLINKWTGMDVRTFAEHLGFDKLVQLSSFINPAGLLEEACAIGHEPAVRMLLEKYAKRNDWSDDMQPDMQRSFRRAVLSGSDEVVQLLLDFDVDVNAPDEFATTALHDAAEMGYDGIASLLLDVGADTQKMDAGGNMPMDLALEAGYEAVVRLLMGHHGAIVTSSTAAATPVTKGDRYMWRYPYLCTGFEATVVHFYVEPPEDADTGDTGPQDAHRVQKVSVEKLVRNADGLFDEVVAVSSGSESYPEADFQWIHLPANCMEWVEDLMTTLRSDTSDDLQYPDVLKDELEIDGSSSSSGSFVAFMPYLHWESEAKRQEIDQQVKELESAAIKLDALPFARIYHEEITAMFGKDPDDAAQRYDAAGERNSLLMLQHLFPVPHQPPLHLRRSLDQFQYYMAENTADCGTEQVVSCYLKRRHANIPSPIMMVDQLWIWVMNRKTVVTSFPEPDIPRGQPRESNILDMRNVLDSTLNCLKQKERTPVTSVFDLAELIMAHSLGLNSEKTEWDYERCRYLEIYDYSINHVANEEIGSFNAFADAARKEGKGKLDNGKEKGKRKTKEVKQTRPVQRAAKKVTSNSRMMVGGLVKEVGFRRVATPKGGREKKEDEGLELPAGLDDQNGDHLRLFGELGLAFLETRAASQEARREEDSFDISNEVKLLQDIKLIRGELNILMNLYSQQKAVVEPFTRIIQVAREKAADKPGSAACSPSSKSSLAAAVDRQIAYVERMDLEDLLDLKQKQANVFEARTARVSGKTITVFTIVTIIFLPASFMAAFLALPILEYPSIDDDKMELGYAIRYTVIVTTTVAFPFIILALYVNPILRLIKAAIRPVRAVIQLCRKAAPYLLISVKYSFFLLVRLLRPLAEHAERPVGAIALELRTVSLDDDVSYAALSYVWGNPADTMEVEINGCPSVVTRSLHSALEQFQKNDVCPWLWIDAVCIEQSILSEKNHQIRVMGDIYSGAEVVYMWLGLGTEDTDAVMDLVSRFGPGLHAGGALDTRVKWGVVSRLVQEISAAFPDDNNDDEDGANDVPDGWGLGMAVHRLHRKVFKTQEPVRRGVEGILTRSYWSRIWIIQEVVLACRAVVVVGTRSAPAELFDATLFTMDRTAIVSSLGLGGTTCLVLSLGTRRTSGREDFARPRLQDLLWERRAASGRPHYAASDPRDLVFGLLGLLSEEEKRDLHVDYAQSYVDVFAQATRTMLRTGEKKRGDFLFCLADLPPGTPDGPLPTWVPDWRDVGARGIMTWGVNDARKFRAARDRSQPSREPGDCLDGSRILCRWGCLVDKVTDVMEAPDWIWVDSYEVPRQTDVDWWFRSIVPFVGLGPDPGPGEGYVWRTVSNGKPHELVHTLPCDCRLLETE
ncbi:hypothetical protein CcaCcLH18_07653 [Colletotrichum camelliae]|nr:hypothetical protein CcaCcLH18_07653 [Colletotrichum camelliae]